MKQIFACVPAGMLMAGLGCQQPVQQVHTKYSTLIYEDDLGGVPQELTSETSLNELRSKNVYVSGLLAGEAIRLRSGELISASFAKGPPPLAIKFGNQSLAIVPDTDEIARLLLGYTNRRVTIQGQLQRAPVTGRGEGAQAGYSGPIPDHEVYFIFVKSCRLLEDAEHKSQTVGPNDSPP